MQATFINNTRDISARVPFWIKGYKAIRYNRDFTIYNKNYFTV